MKKICSILFVMLLALLIIGACGEPEKEADISKASIGVIETNGNKKDSRLIFYDGDLNEVANSPLKYATVGDIFSNPVVYDGELYVIPQGYANEKDEEKALRISLSDLSKKEYEIKQLAMNCISTDEKYIYTCNSSMEASYINRCGKENGEVDERELKNIYISNLLCYQGCLYVFGETIDLSMESESSGEQAYLYVYNSEFELTDTVDITECGMSHYKAIAQGNYIIFSNEYDNKENANHTVSMFSIEDHTLETVDLEGDYPWDLAVYNDILIVSHYEPFEMEGSGVSFYNMSSGEKEYFPMEHGAEQMALSGECLYFLAEPNLYKYKIKGMGMEFVSETEIKMNSDNYISGLFAF